MIFSKDDLFVLCCLWDYGAQLRLLYSNDPGLVFNIPYTPVNIASSIDGLEERKMLKISEWKSLSGQRIAGLTRMGGEYFEELFSIDWREYISEPQRRRSERVYRVTVLDDSMAERLEEWFSERIGRKFFRMDVERASRLVYWKSVSCLRLLFRFDSKNSDEIVFEMFNENYSEFGDKLSKNFKFYITR